MFDPLMFMMLHGIRVDQQSLANEKTKVRGQIEVKRSELEALITSKGHKPFSPTSSKQIMDYFYGTLGIKPYLNRKTGKPTSDDTAMARLFRKHRLPEAKLIQEIKNLEKLSGTYLEIEFDKDGRLRCAYNPRGTVTGRLSSGKTIHGTGMNNQNLDPRFRGFLIPDDDPREEVS